MSEMDKVAMWNRVCSRVAQGEDYATVCYEEGISPHVADRHMDGRDVTDMLLDRYWMKARLDAARDVADPPPPPWKGHSVEYLMSIIPGANKANRNDPA